VDAYTTVATLQRYAMVIAELESFHSADPKRIHKRYCGQMDAMRDNVSYNNDAEMTAAITEEQERRFGKAIADTSDAALVSLGFVKKE